MKLSPWFARALDVSDYNLVSFPGPNFEKNYCNQVLIKKCNFFWTSQNRSSSTQQSDSFICGQNNSFLLRVGMSNLGKTDWRLRNLRQWGEVLIWRIIMLRLKKRILTNTLYLNFICIIKTCSYYLQAALNRIATTQVFGYLELSCSNFFFVFWFTYYEIHLRSTVVLFFRAVSTSHKVYVHHHETCEKKSFS